MKNIPTVEISNTDSISFICAFGYKSLGYTEGRTRDDDKYTLRYEDKGYSKPFTLYRRHFYQHVSKYHTKYLNVVRTKRRRLTNACADYDMF